jgi:hypothetical protein
MAKHTNQEAYFQRLKNLADVNKPQIKESKFRNLGSLIDYKRASDGVAYGIIKENHNYYLKKAGTKQDPNVADFAYIGGMENITGFQYKTLAEADKQRNMIFHTINEAAIPKVDKNGSKKKLNEDLAGKEIDQAASKLGSLDAATSAEAQPAPVEPEGGAEMAAGLDAKPAGETPAEEPAPDSDGGPAPDLGGDPEGGPAPDLGGGDEELPPADDTEAGTEELPASDDENPDASADGAMGGGENDAMTDLQKSLGKITNTIRKTEMEDVEVKGLVNTFLASFKDKLRDMDIEDRKEMANKLLKVVGNDEIEDLGDSIPQEKPEGSELGPEAGLGKKEPEIAEEEQPCAECGGLPEYAKSRGYDSAQSFMECDDEEKANVISGYANAHNDGQNDGDFKTIAIVITPEILEKLKSEYGHEDFANEVEPFANEMNESSDEDKMAQLNELWGGLGNLAKGAMGGIKAGANAVSGAVGNKYNQAKQAVGGAIDTAKAGVQKAATGIKQSYNAGEVPAEVKKLQGVAANLGKQIDALNKRMTAAGQQPIDVKTILKAVTQQVTGKGAGIGGLNPSIAEGANGVDPSNTVVSEPNMLKETDKKVAPGNKVVSEPNMLKEDDETEEPEKEFDVDSIETPEGGEETGEVGIEPEVSTEPEVDAKPEIGFAPAAQSLGAGVVKADGAGVEIRVEPDKTVTLTMNESEIKLRKYVRQRLQEKAGLRKPILTESKKSVNLKKLDAMIDEQFKLYEGKVVKKKSKVNEVFGWSIAEKIAKLDPNDEAGVKALFQEAFKNILINPMMSVIGTAANRATTQEKYALLQQFAQGGGGTLRLGKDGKLIYASKEFQDKGTGGGLSSKNYGAITR